MAKKCGLAKVTTPSLRATPPWEGNLQPMPIFAVAKKFPSYGGQGQGGYTNVT